MDRGMDCQPPAQISQGPELSIGRQPSSRSPSDASKSLFESFNECCCTLSGRCGEPAVIRDSVSAIVRILGENSVERLMEHVPTGFDLDQTKRLLLDRLISIDPMVANVLQQPDSSLKTFLFGYVLDNLDHFPAAHLLRFFKRLYILKEHDFLFDHLATRAETWGLFLDSLSGPELHRLGLECLVKRRDVALLGDLFRSHLDVELVLYLTAYGNHLSTAECSLLVAKVPSADLFHRLLRRYWVSDSFANDTPQEFHSFVSTMLFLSCPRRAGKAPDACCTDLIIRGIGNHLCSRSKEKRTIAMVFGETTTLGPSSVNFELDATDPLVQKWRSVSDCSPAVPAERPRCAPNAARPIDLDALVNSLKELKLKPPAYIGELVQLLREKKDHTAMETLFAYAPGIIEGCDKTEVHDHFETLLRQVVYLRDDFEMDGFLERKSLLISLLVKKSCIPSVDYLVQQIYSGRLSDGERVFVLDVLNELLEGCNRPSRASTASDPVYALSDGKTRYLSFSALRAASLAQPAPMDPFRLRYVPALFFSLARRAGGELGAPAVYEKILLTLANSLVSAASLPDLHRMVQEFVALLAPLSLNRGSPSSWSQKVLLCCYYAVFSVAPAGLLEEEYLPFLSRVCDEIDALSAADKDIRSLVEGILTICSQKLPALATL